MKIIIKDGEATAGPILINNDQQQKYHFRMNSSFKSQKRIKFS